VALALLLALATAASGAARAEPPPAAPPASAEPGSTAPRPADLVVLQDRVGRDGRQLIGVFGVVVDPAQPDLRRVRVWEELRDRVTISTDVVRCSPAQPMRMTGNATQLILRELNPGGAITLVNRMDHQIWWAACVPAQAGKDPATLGPLARQLGYSGNLQERQQVLPAPHRPPSR
jgi:hypothetical protein